MVTATVSEANNHPSDEEDAIIRTSTIHKLPNVETAVSAQGAAPERTMEHTGESSGENGDCGVTPNDILLGRGSGPNQSSGNTKFRTLVWDTFKEYVAERNKGTDRYGDEEETIFHPLDAATKNRLARRILEKVQSTNGRFLRRLTRLEHQRVSEENRTRPIEGEENTHYEQISSKEAMEKIKQSLRFQIDQRGRQQSATNLKRPSQDEEKRDVEPPRKRLQRDSSHPLSRATALKRTENDMPFSSPVSRPLLPELMRGPGVMEYALWPSFQCLPFATSHACSGSSPFNLLSTMSHGPGSDILAIASAATNRQQQLASLIAAGLRNGDLQNISRPSYNHELTRLILHENSELASIDAASADLEKLIRQKQQERLLLESTEDRRLVGGIERFFSPLQTTTLSASSFVADPFGTASIFGNGVAGGRSNVSETPLFRTGGGYPPHSSFLSSLH